MKTIQLTLITANIVVVVAGFAVRPAAHAQTFTNLHTFAGAPADGRNPYGGVISSGSKLYGTTGSGGVFDQGTIFAINGDGTGFTNLHSFATNEGYSPLAGVILSGNTLYGTTPFGGNNDNGTIFAVSTNGTGFTTLHHFAATAEAPDAFNSPTNHEGGGPRGLILAGNTLYGAASHGGITGNGTIFKLNTNGTGFAVVHSFAAIYSGFPGTNSEGAGPNSTLLLAGNTLYGGAVRGGAAGNGTLFAVNTDGTGFTNLHDFTAVSSGTNEDGIYPDGQLVLSGNALFGTAPQGGNAANGVIFTINTNGTGFTVLHHFTRSPGYPFSTINGDGANPYGGLVLSGNTLFGKTVYGGSEGWGTIFAMKVDGTGFTRLFSFAAAIPPATTNATGYNPLGGFVLSGNTLYGTASQGGTQGYGTIFSLTLPSPPALTIARSGGEAVLSWPTNSAGLWFTLQSTTNLAATTNWSTVSPLPVIVNGEHSVTNPIAGIQKFYRLSQ